MKPERWQQIERLYHAALEREANQRAAFLAEACAGDDSLRREVESLLACEAQVGSFIETPPGAVAARVMDVQQEDSLVGRMIGSWRILSLLGAGGMGRVYLAQDTRLGRKVALKLLPAEFTRDAERVRRFRLEARAASSLNHPNIITIHEIGEVGAAHFIVTEYVEGETLRAQINRAPDHRMNLSTVLDLAAQIASALAAAHEAGIVHRDIKPENVMVRRDGYVKVLDFGLAKLFRLQIADYGLRIEEAETLPQAEPANPQSTLPGVVIGTPRYMSPEQARGQKVDARTDIFSLGVMLYEMLAGHPPFEGATPGDVIAAILKTDPAPLSQHSPEVLPDLERIVTKALQKDREDRYQTISDFLADLKNLRQQPESGTKPERAQDKSAAAAPATSSAEYLLGEIKRHKRSVFLALTALVVAGAVIVWWLAQLFGRQSGASAPALKITRLTQTGKAVQSAVSPDGKYVVYVKDEAGRQSLWLIQVATTSDEQILPPAEVSYRGITFSRDGNFIYYVRDEQKASTGTLYRKPVLGGAERKLLFNVDSPVTLSPDGSQLAFARITPSFSASALMIANADGTEERKLAVRKSPGQFSRSGAAWSPDSKLIAIGILNFAEGFSANVVVVRVADGTEQSPRSWQWLMSEGRPTAVGSRSPHLGRLAWNAEGSALFLTINEQTESEPQIWQLSWPEGEARKLTSDLSGYDDVTLTAGLDTLVAVRADQIINLQVAPDGDHSRLRQLTSGAGRMDGVRGLGWTPDGRIVYRSLAGGSPHIWITAVDGTGSKQLTVAAHNNIDPAVSPDGRYIVWGVNRNGRFSIWRMEPDGSNAKQITSGAGEWFPQYSPDGNWLVYRTFSPGIVNALWKASLSGGAAVRLTKDIGWLPVLSPDGKLIACQYRNAASTSWQITLIPFEGGPPRFIEFVDPSYHRPVRWMPNGRALAYPVTRNGVSNLWAQPLDGSPPKQLTDFRDQLIFNFAWSRDGKQLALSRGTVNSDVVLISNFR